MTMKNVGFYGGSSLRELGPSADVALFFECLDTYVAKGSGSWDLLKDRLYRRYLKEDELNEASALMRKVKEAFAELPSSSVDWGNLLNVPNQTRLDPHQSNLMQVFFSYFEAFDYCVESAIVFLKSWNIYQPVRLVVSDLPDFMNEKKRLLEQYDDLEGSPFWLR